MNDRQLPPAGFFCVDLSVLEAVETVDAGVGSADTSLDTLYRLYAAELAASLRKQFGDVSAEADDIVQQAFEKLSACSDLSHVSNLKAFLWRTARNLMVNAIGRATSDPSMTMR